MDNNKSLTKLSYICFLLGYCISLSFQLVFVYLLDTALCLDFLLCVHSESSEGEKWFCISEELNLDIFTPLLKPNGLHRGQQLLKGNMIFSILLFQIRVKKFAFSEGAQEEPRKEFFFFAKRDCFASLYQFQRTTESQND